MRPHSRDRGHIIFEAEAKAGCNEAKAKAEAVIFGLPRPFRGLNIPGYRSCIFHSRIFSAPASFCICLIWISASDLRPIFTKKWRYIYIYIRSEIILTYILSYLLTNLSMHWDFHHG